MTATTETAPPQDAKPGAGRVLVEWVVILAIALGVALLVKTFLIQPFFIPSGSMEPTLLPGDRVLVNKLSYQLHAVHEGDVVVFKRPPNDNDPQISDLIKRVIGLPGESIQAKGGNVYINGKLLNQPYLRKGTVTTSLPYQVVPKGEYFVMGDNRGNSYDSRYWGYLPANLIVGHAFAVVWPLNRIGSL
jgi:signal peptidase I